MSKNKEDRIPTVRSSEEIEKSLLRRAFAAGCQPEMEQKIKELRDRVNDMPEGHVEGMTLAHFFDEECGSSQALRSVSLLDDKFFYKSNTLRGESDKEDSPSDITYTVPASKLIH